MVVGSVMLVEMVGEGADGARQFVEGAFDIDVNAGSVIVKFSRVQFHIVGTVQNNRYFCK